MKEGKSIVVEVMRKTKTRKEWKMKYSNPNEIPMVLYIISLATQSKVNIIAQYCTVLYNDEGYLLQSAVRLGGLGVPPWQTSGLGTLTRHLPPSWSHSVNS